MCKGLRIITIAVCALFLWPLSAQEKSDTVYTFRFVPQKDMFYVPWSGNDTELARLEDCMKRYRSEILSGYTPLYVDGYCNSFDSETENLATAKTRSNRVKSELIVRQKLTEDCFITRNHSGSGDYVTVRIVISADKDGETTEQQNMVGAWLCDYAESRQPFDEIKHRHTLKEVGDVTEGRYDWKIERGRGGVTL